MPPVDVLGADGAAVATCRPQRWVGRGASVRFEAGDRRFAFRLETADAARALLLLLDDYAAAAWAELQDEARAALSTPAYARFGMDRFLFGEVLTHGSLAEALASPARVAAAAARVLLSVSVPRRDAVDETTREWAGERSARSR